MLTLPQQPAPLASAVASHTFRRTAAINSSSFMPLFSVLASTVISRLFRLCYNRFNTRPRLGRLKQSNRGKGGGDFSLAFPAALCLHSLVAGKIQRPGFAARIVPAQPPDLFLGGFFVPTFLALPFILSEAAQEAERLAGWDSGLRTCAVFAHFFWLAAKEKVP